MSWKLDRDPFYADLARRFGREFVDEAGFFEDTDAEDARLDDVRLLCTPLGKVASNLKRASRPPVVIISTGAFCPVHPGHLELMEVARNRVEEAGFDVVGGYLSPGHDEYLRLKLGNEATSSQERMEQCTKAVLASDWLMVDPWEALYRRVAVNFTDVLTRLEAYLREHFDEEIVVFYAFGGDNARFSLTFAEKGHAVVVGRPGYEEAFSKYRSHSLNEANSRVLWARNAIEGSSTEVRKRTEKRDPIPRPRLLFLRCEDSPVAPGSKKDWREFQKQLVDLLGCWFEVTRRSQHRAGRAFSRPTISLDPLTPSSHSLKISRLFEFGGYAQQSHIARPGSPSLQEQIAWIPAGEYDVVDDDVCTGGTITKVKALLRPQVSIRDTQTHLNTTGGAGRVEIADSRDFLLGATDAGLVMKFRAEEAVRGPYVYPYVDPCVRCSIPPEEALEFSIKVWRLNEKFHERSRMRVAEVPNPQRELLIRAGFGDDDVLSHVSRWHRTQLEDLRRRRGGT